MVLTVVLWSQLTMAAGHMSPVHYGYLKWILAASQCVSQLSVLRKWRLLAGSYCVLYVVVVAVVHVFSAGALVATLHFTCRVPFMLVSVLVRRRQTMMSLCFVMCIHHQQVVLRHSVGSTLLAKHWLNYRTLVLRFPYLSSLPPGNQSHYCPCTNVIFQLSCRFDSHILLMTLM